MRTPWLHVGQCGTLVFVRCCECCFSESVYPMKSSWYRRLTASLLSLSLLVGPGAYAAVEPPISIQAHVADQSPDRATHLAAVQAALTHSEVVASLERFGVSRDDAMRRVERLNDAELAQLASDLETAPAGGIVGAIVFVFLVLLLTDILGFTKVYPFTRSIRR